VVRRGRGRFGGGAARARRHRDLSRPHRGHPRGGRPWRPSSQRHGSRARRRGDARAPGRAAPVGFGLTPDLTRSGFVAIAGRPNVGKSTLANAIVGSKVAIISDKPQTTRRAIRGIATGEDWQLVLVDLPGVQRPRDALTMRMQRRVEHELEDADACLLVVNAEQGIGPGGRFVSGSLEGATVPVVIAVNKADRADRARIAEVLSDAEALGVADEIFPVSARTGEGVSAIVEGLVSLLPEGPFYFPPEQHSDLTEQVLLAELVREQVLARTRREVPHAVAVELQAIERP